MASAISSDKALENFSVKNQVAASFNRFTTAPLYCVHGSSISLSFNATADTPSFFWLLCTAYGTGWSVSWNQNANIDVDQRNCAYQTGRTGHDHIIWRFRIYGTAVRWIYASARMGIRVLPVYELLCGCESAPVRVDLFVAAKKRRCPFFNSVMARQSNSL